MEIIKHSDIFKKEEKLINKAIKIAKQSGFGADNKVSCLKVVRPLLLKKNIKTLFL